MNPEWDTPPNGDFARYVERLTAQMALPRPEVQQAPNVIDDVAERPGLGAPQFARPAVLPVPAAGVPVAINAKLVPGVLLGLVVLMVVLNVVFHVSGFVLAMVAVVIGWIAFTLRRVFSGGSMTALRERLERAAQQSGRRP